MTEFEYLISQARLEEAKHNYEIAQLNARFLNISLDEYFDFVEDMKGEVKEGLTTEELEQMYQDYIANYGDVPTYDADYARYDRMGW